MLKDPKSVSKFQALVPEGSKVAPSLLLAKSVANIGSMRAPSSKKALQRLLNKSDAAKVPPPGQDKKPAPVKPPTPKQYVELDLLFFPEDLALAAQRVIPLNRRGSDSEEEISVVSKTEKNMRAAEGSGASLKLRHKPKPAFDNSMSALPNSIFLTETLAQANGKAQDTVQGNFKILTPTELQMMQEQGVRSVPELKQHSGIFMPLEALKCFPEYRKLSERVSSLPKLQPISTLKKAPSVSITRLLNSKRDADEAKAHPILGKYWRQLAYNKKESHGHTRSCVESLDSSVRSIVSQLRDESKKVLKAQEFLFARKPPAENDLYKDSVDDAGSVDDRLSANGAALSRKSRSAPRRKDTGPRNFMLSWREPLIPKSGFIEFREGRACCTDKNKVYFYGGYSSGGSAENEGIQVYDVALNKLESLPYHRSTPTLRAHHRIVKLMDALYIFGGNEIRAGIDCNYFGQVWKFDLQTNKFKLLKTLGSISPRIHHGMVPLGSSHIVVNGGFSYGENSPLDDIQLLAVRKIILTKMRRMQNGLL